MIDLTPLEVRKKKADFRRTMRGYDPQSVDDFLDLVADRLEQLVRENAALQQRVGNVETQVSDYRDRERALTEALVTAQEMREQMRQQMEREAELKRREADAEAEATLSQAAQMREKEEENVRRLRARQAQFVQSYRAFLERELAELSVMTETLDLQAAPATDAPPRRTRKAAAPPPPPMPEPVQEPEPVMPPEPVKQEAPVAQVEERMVNTLPETVSDSEPIAADVEEEISGVEEDIPALDDNLDAFLHEPIEDLLDLTDEIEDVRLTEVDEDEISDDLIEIEFQPEDEVLAEFDEDLPKEKKKPEDDDDGGWISTLLDSNK